MASNAPAGSRSVTRSARTWFHWMNSSVSYRISASVLVLTLAVGGALGWGSFVLSRKLVEDAGVLVELVLVPAACRNLDGHVEVHNRLPLTTDASVPYRDRSCLVVWPPCSPLLPWCWVPESRRCWSPVSST